MATNELLMKTSVRAMISSARAGDIVAFADWLDAYTEEIASNLLSQFGPVIAANAIMEALRPCPN